MIFSNNLIYSGQLLFSYTGTQQFFKIPLRILVEKTVKTLKPNAAMKEWRIFVFKNHHRNITTNNGKQREKICIIHDNDDDNDHAVNQPAATGNVTRFNFKV